MNLKHGHTWKLRKRICSNTIFTKSKEDSDEKLKHNFKKGMAFVLSLAMVAGLVPAMSGGANTVQAATGSGTEPSVTAYATKDQLMTAFNPDSNGDATTIGKLVFGKIAVALRRNGTS